MHNIIKSTKILTLILIGLFLYSCESDDNSVPVEGTNSIVNYLEKDSTFTLFSKAIDRADLRGVLDGNSGSFTVLAPNDEAMETYLQDEGYDNINQVPEEDLKRLVSYHILETLTPKDNFITSYIPTLATVVVNDSVDANLSIFVNTIDSVEFNGYAGIIEGDISVDNGILHKIDHTLALPTIETFMTADDNLKAYYDKITANDVTTDFEGMIADPDERLTILVPNENAVIDFFEGEGSGLDANDLNKIYNYQLLDTLTLSTELKTEYINTKYTENYSGENYPLNIYVNAEAGLLLNGYANVVIADLVTINGNIQVLDQVLKLPTLKTFIDADIRFEDFKDQLSRDDQASEAYLDLLEESTSESHAPFTVFAPDNKAFDDVLSELFPDEEVTFEDIEADDMTALLNLHIHENSALREDDFSDQNLNTLGGTLQIQVGDTISIEDPAGRKSNVLDGNIQATNGVMHHIDQVLLPN